MKITIPNRSLLDGIVHGSVWRQGAFTWEPTAFVLESEKLEGKIIEASVQDESLQHFRENPLEPQIYVVSGSPDDSKAKYFAAYLAMIHMNAVKFHSVVWEPIFGGFDNRLMKTEQQLSMLIISGLAENSTNFKIEKARDLIERFADIPRVVVCAGEDPISFASTKLHVPCHSMAYFPSRLARTVQEVI
jgi:hypothetical protein